MRTRIAGVVLALSAAGCASRSLPLRHVVVYRNGVAYFERAGHVAADEVRFRMHPGQVGDFLATLSVVERGGSTVRAAALPTRDEHDDKDEWGLKTVALSLDGKGHDLQVGYVTEAPMWKPSYRLLVRDETHAELQAWSVVQNLSGEDRNDVQLSLAGGAPIAFTADLDTPETPLRPRVGAGNEDVSRLDQAIQAAQVTVQEPSFHAKAARSDGPEPSIVPRRPVATLGVQGSAARYDLASPVTIRDRTTTMLLFLSRTVPAVTSLLYAFDERFPESAEHPFRVVTFTNDTGGALEPGPITVAGATAFLGQGVLAAVQAGSVAVVRYALDGDVEVTPKGETVTEARGARLSRVVDGTLEVLRASSLRIHFHVRNDSPQPRKLLLQLHRKPGTTLFQPPDGTKEDSDKGIALIPVEVPARGAIDPVVDQHAPAREIVDWFSPLADEAVRGYLGDPKADRDVAGQLAAAWQLHDEYVHGDGERSTLRQQAYSARSAETRAGLERRIVALDAKLGPIQARFTSAVKAITVSVSTPVTP